VVRKDASTLMDLPSLSFITCVHLYSILLSYLFIYLLFLGAAPYRLLESPPALKHAPIKLAIYKLLCLAAKHRTHNLHT
jgi:hypothetical protein